MKKMLALLVSVAFALGSVGFAVAQDTAHDEGRLVEGGRIASGRAASRCTFTSRNSRAVSWGASLAIWAG